MLLTTHTSLLYSQGRRLGAGQYPAEPIFENGREPPTSPLNRRNPWKVLGFSPITLGIYYLYWLYVTKSEMEDGGAEIPSFWLLVVSWFIPMFGWALALYWYWKFSKGVETVTDKEMRAVVAFLPCLLSMIGAAIIQWKLNKFAT